VGSKDTALHWKADGTCRLLSVAFPVPKWNRFLPTEKGFNFLIFYIESNGKGNGGRYAIQPQTVIRARKNKFNAQFGIRLF